MKAKRDVKGLIKALDYHRGKTLTQKIVDVRKAAASALGEIGDARAVEPLIAAFTRGNHDVIRKVAGEALAQIGTPAVEPLIAVLKDAAIKVRQYRGRD